MKNANAKYAITSGGESVGLVWESNGREVIVFNKNVRIDLDFGFEIIDVETAKVVAQKMWIDVITEEMPKINKDNSIVYNGTLNVTTTGIDNKKLAEEVFKQMAEMSKDWGK